MFVPSGRAFETANPWILFVRRAGVSGCDRDATGRRERSAGAAVVREKLNEGCSAEREARRSEVE